MHSARVDTLFPLHRASGVIILRDQVRARGRRMTRGATSGAAVWILSIAAAGFVLVSVLPSGVSGSTIGTPPSSSIAPHAATPHGSPPVGNNSTWISLNVSNPPAPRWLPGITYDPATQSVLLTGGSNGPNFPPQTWSLANSTWTNITATSGPNPPDVTGMVYDSDLGLVVAYGDVSGFGVTFEFANGT